MFTALIGEAGRQFGLGTSAAALVNELLRFIARTPGGLAGFLARFEAAGMGLLVSSWLGDSESEPTTVGQLEGALGADTLRRIGRKVGLPGGTVGPALAFLVPRVIGMLTPDRIVPADLAELSPGPAPNRVAAVRVLLRGPINGQRAEMQDILEHGDVEQAVRGLWRKEFRPNRSLASIAPPAKTPSIAPSRLETASLSRAARYPG